LSNKCYFGSSAVTGENRHIVQDTFSTNFALILFSKHNYFFISKFFCKVGVQELLSMIWRGNIHMDQPYTQVYICLLLPVLPFLPSKLITFDANVRKTSWWRKFLWVYQAPVAVFLYNILFFAIYLGFFANVITANFCNNPHWTEWVVITWTATLIFEEIRQILHESGKTPVAAWWKDLYNKFDFFGYALFIIGGVRTGN
jgi:hypothetical protein